jgi:hypothetical protein
LLTPFWTRFALHDDLAVKKDIKSFRPCSISFFSAIVHAVHDDRERAGGLSHKLLGKRNALIERPWLAIANLCRVQVPFVCWMGLCDVAREKIYPSLRKVVVQRGDAL